MRWLIVLLVACSNDKPASAPAAVPPRAAPIDAPSIDAPVLEAAPPVRSLTTQLVVEGEPSARVVVKDRGPVEIDGRPVELDQLAAALRKTTAKDGWKPPGDKTALVDAAALDGTLWLRMLQLAPRPLLVAHPSIPAIRIFEVARAAKRGVTLQVLDESNANRSFGFRSTDALDHDPGNIDNAISITIRRRTIEIGDITLPLSAPTSELTDAVRAIARPPSQTVRWAFVELRGGSHTIALVVAAMEALALGADIDGISFIAGVPGVKHIEIEADTIPRRYIKQHLRATFDCYDKFPTLAGRIDLTFTVTDKTAKSPTATGIDPALAACIAKAYETTEIPNQTGPTLVIPLILELDGGYRRDL